MCRKHLLGEHVECHMLVGCLKKKKNIKGYLDTGLVSPAEVRKRHDLLAGEMSRRKYRHRTPMNKGLLDWAALEKGSIDRKKNCHELASRCKACCLSLQ